MKIENNDMILGKICVIWMDSEMVHHLNFRLTSLTSYRLAICQLYSVWLHMDTRCQLHFLLLVQYMIQKPFIARKLSKSLLILLIKGYGLSKRMAFHLDVILFTCRASNSTCRDNRTRWMFVPAVIASPYSGIQT